MTHTKYNTPPHKLDETNPAIWHTIEKDDKGNIVIVLRTRDFNAARAAQCGQDLLDAAQLAFDIIEGILENESLTDCAANNLASVSGALEDAIEKARGQS